MSGSAPMRPDRRFLDWPFFERRHRAFVNDVWLPNVADFLELDYVRG